MGPRTSHHRRRGGPSNQASLNSALLLVAAGGLEEVTWLWSGEVKQRGDASKWPILVEGGWTAGKQTCFIAGRPRPTSGLSQSYPWRKGDGSFWGERQRRGHRGSGLGMVLPPPGSGYAGPEDETSYFPDTYDPMMEYPGTMRPGRFPENQAYQNLPLADEDPDPVPWPHFQEVEWHHQWPVVDPHPVTMDDFIESHGRWASAEDEADLRAGVRMQVRERREMEESQAMSINSVITDDEEEDDTATTTSRRNEGIDLGDGIQDVLLDATDQRDEYLPTKAKDEVQEELSLSDEDEDDEEEEEEEEDDFLLDLGLDESSSAPGDIEDDDESELDEEGEDEEYKSEFAPSSPIREDDERDSGVPDAVQQLIDLQRAGTTVDAEIDVKETSMNVDGEEGSFLDLGDLDLALTDDDADAAASAAAAAGTGDDDFDVDAIIGTAELGSEAITEDDEELELSILDEDDELDREEISVDDPNLASANGGDGGSGNMDGDLRDSGGAVDLDDLSASEDMGDDDAFDDGGFDYDEDFESGDVFDGDFGDDW